jgi:hypothetical protein
MTPSQDDASMLPAHNHNVVEYKIGDSKAHGGCGEWGNVSQFGCVHLGSCFETLSTQSNPKAPQETATQREPTFSAYKSKVTASAGKVL